MLITRRRRGFLLAAVSTAAALALTVSACASSDSGGPGQQSSSDGQTAGDDASGGNGAADSDGGTDNGAATADASDATAPGSAGPASSRQPGATLTVYSGQHEALVKQIADGFTAATGIGVEIRAGDDAELANQIIEEGAGSPADLFVSEEPGPVGLLDSKGLLSPVAPDTLGEVDQRLVPSSGNWMPYAARSRVIYYNPELIGVDELPDSILDLTDPKWKGMFAYAPSGAFTSTVSYLIDSIGPDKTLAWLQGIKANGINEQKNGKVRDSVEAGQHAFGLSNHYYWYFLAKEKGGPENMTSKVYYFDHPDAGGLLLPSGAAVVKASQHQDEAQQFLAWLGSADGGQQIIAQAEAAQYPVAPGVTSDSGLPPLSDLHFPQVDVSIYSDTTQAKDLIIEAGIA